MRNRRKPCNHSLHEVEVGKENTAPSTVAGLTDELATGCCSDFPLAVHHFQKQYVMGYTTLLFQGITHHSLFYAVYNPVVSEPYMPLPQLFCDTQPCRFRVLYTRHRHGYSVPQRCRYHLSHDYQPTEYSCFHDDHASPQALIPVIPSVLVFNRFQKTK